MWGNPTLFHRENLLRKILKEDKYWQKLLTEKRKYQHSQ